jgi:hypothetical protein
VKANRIVIVVLSLLVVFLAYFALKKGGTPGGEQPFEKQPIEITRTNTVESWHTNTVERWRTNTVEVWRTNRVVEVVTNEVVKEVPAKLSELEIRTATVGYQYLNAPVLTNRADTLYKASPLAVGVSMDATVRNMLGEDAGVKASIERALRAQAIPVAEKSPYHLSVDIAVSWTTDVPGVRLCALSAELKESVAVRRQNDVVAGAGVVWRAAIFKLLRTDNGAEDARNAIQALLDKFGGDYRRAKESEKEVESRIPAVPPEFLSQGK